jgi:hypothetical protein
LLALPELHAALVRCGWLSVTSVHHCVFGLSCAMVATLFDAVMLCSPGLLGMPVSLGEYISDAHYYSAVVLSDAFFVTVASMCVAASSICSW